jgi:hypothetical protein
MNLNSLFRSVSNIGAERTAENYANQKISQFKTSVLISIIGYGLAALIILGVVLYVGFMVVKNL